MPTYEQLKQRINALWVTSERLYAHKSTISDYALGRISSSSNKRQNIIRQSEDVTADKATVCSLTESAWQKAKIHCDKCDTDVSFAAADGGGLCCSSCATFRSFSTDCIVGHHCKKLEEDTLRSRIGICELAELWQQRTPAVKMETYGTWSLYTSPDYEPGTTLWHGTGFEALRNIVDGQDIVQLLTPHQGRRICGMKEREPHSLGAVLSATGYYCVATRAKLNAWEVVVMGFNCLDVRPFQGISGKTRGAGAKLQHVGSDPRLTCIAAGVTKTPGCVSPGVLMAA